MTMCRATPTRHKAPQPVCNHEAGKTWVFPPSGRPRCACGRCGEFLIVSGDKWVADTPENRADEWETRHDPR